MSFSQWVALVNAEVWHCYSPRALGNHHRGWFDIAYLVVGDCGQVSNGEAFNMSEWL